MNKKLIELADRLRAAVYPDRCFLCGRVIEYQTELCSDCKKTKTLIREEICTSCALPKKKCNCKNKSNFYNGITAPFLYKDEARHGIWRWKFRNRRSSTDSFALMIASAVNRNLKSVSFDVVTFIPQTAKEKEKRGYNQGEILANSVAGIMNLPCKPLLKKLYETERQHNLLKVERSGNIFGVFNVSDKAFVDGKSVLIIDDIKTSGATLNECAKMLVLNNAKSVYCAVIAVAENPK